VVSRRRPGRRWVGWLLALAAGHCLGSCQAARGYLAQLDRQTWAAYHASRWQAVLDSCAGGRPYTAPARPVTPRRCAGLEPQYRALAQGWAEQDALLPRLAAERTVEQEYLAELLDVLQTRDRERIAGLAGQLPGYEDRLAAAQRQWRELQLKQAERLAALEGGWEALWPAAEGQDLDFDLASGVARTRQAWPPPEAARVAELTEFHRQHYSRLAMVYLDFEPDFKPLPAEQVTVPPDCQDLAASIERYERGLRVRYDLNEALEADLARLGELAGFNPAVQDWALLELPKKGWQRQRTEAAVARLGLLGRAGELLAGGLDLQQAALEQAWRQHWPGCPLELNIFAFAGQTEAVPAPVPFPGWQDLTFRK
jgi:hypothetical protein